MSELLNQPLVEASAETTATTADTEINPTETVVSEAPQELILGKFKSDEDVRKAYTNLESMLGKKVENFSPDDLAVLNSLRGVPKAKEEYKVVEGTPVEVADWFKDQAHKLKLTNNDVLELTAAYKARLEADIQAAEQAMQHKHEENAKALRQEFGAAFESRIKLANEAADQIGGEEFKAALRDAGLGSEPVVIKALAKLGTMLAEDTIPKSMQGAAFGTSPEEAKSLIKTRMNDPVFRQRYMNAGSPGHDDAVAEMLRLHELANPQ